VSFEQLVAMMVDHDLELARQQRTLAQAGHIVVSRGLSHG
jgi:GDPmannose 4,6-dehydratase